MTESSGVPMQLRRMFTVYVLTLGLCLLFVSSRTADEKPPQDVEWFGGPADVIVPEGADAPPKTLATPKGSRAVKALALGDFDIPLTALLAYQRAADILAEASPTCELPWTLLAAIGRVESNHGRYAGATLDADGVSTPQVVGVALNGDGPVAKIPDTDGGRLDQDPKWDRAVGPMQFIPSTWEMVGVDGDGDGVRSIHDIDDAALAAGVYLCAGSDSLREDAAMEAALFRYNDSDSYVALVMAYEEAYRTGDFSIATAGGSVTAAAAVLTGPTLGATPLPRSARPSEKLRARIVADVRKAVATATEAGATTPGISGSPTPGRPSASATPSEERSGETSAATSTSGAGSSTPSSTGNEGGGSTATDEQSGGATPTAPETSGGSSESPPGPTSAPSEPSPSGPVADPSGTTPSGGASTPSGPASDAPADDSSSADPTPAACETESPAADATETPSPEPSSDPTADPTTDPDDPCKPTESPSTATESPGP